MTVAVDADVRARRRGRRAGAGCPRPQAARDLLSYDADRRRARLVAVASHSRSPRAPGRRPRSTGASFASIGAPAFTCRSPGRGRVATSAAYVAITSLKRRQTSPFPCTEEILVPQNRRGHRCSHCSSRSRSSPPPAVTTTTSTPTDGGTGDTTDTAATAAPRPARRASTSPTSTPSPARSPTASPTGRDAADHRHRARLDHRVPRRGPDRRRSRRGVGHLRHLRRVRHRGRRRGAWRRCRRPDRLPVEPERQRDRREPRVGAGLARLGRLRLLRREHRTSCRRSRSRTPPTTSACTAPTPETIASGDYPLSRPLYIYVNNAKAAESGTVAAYVDPYLGDLLRLRLRGRLRQARPTPTWPTPWPPGRPPASAAPRPTAAASTVSGSSTVEPISASASWPRPASRFGRGPRHR